MHLILAPLQGVTGYLFRNAWSSFFTGIDEAFSPFIPLVTGTKVKAACLSDVLPANNQVPFRIIPQVMGNQASQFRLMASALADLGYGEINWNMGCPSSIVTRRMRGCGLMPYPGVVDTILSEIIPELPLQLSVKLRSGMHSNEELWPMLRVLNKYPLKRIILHPRLGVQHYNGTPDLEAFRKAQEISAHPMVYNGDINDPGGFARVQQFIPGVNSWMLGRGVLFNPFLPSLIRGDEPVGKEDMRQKLAGFNEALIASLLQQGYTGHRVLSRLKEFWSYFSFWFEDSQTVWTKVSHALSLQVIKDSMQEAFSGELGSHLLPDR